MFQISIAKLGAFNQFWFSDCYGWYNATHLQAEITPSS